MDATEAQVVSRVTSLTIQSVRELCSDLIHRDQINLQVIPISSGSYTNSPNSLHTTHSHHTLSSSTEGRTERGASHTLGSREEASSISPLDGLVDGHPIGAAEFGSSLEELSGWLPFEESFYGVRPIGQSEVLNGPA